MRLERIDPVDEKARRFGLVKVRCTRCYGTGTTVDADVTSPDGRIRRPCECGGRGYWYSRPGSGMWMSPADVEAQTE